MTAAERLAKIIDDGNKNLIKERQMVEAKQIIKKVKKSKKNKNILTEIIIVLDRSGSMGVIKSDTIGGFNEFLKTQKEVPGKANLTLAQFDDQYDVLYNGIDIQDIPNLTEETFVPRGWTALFDAIGKTMNITAERLSKSTDKPDQVLFVIITDGEENASREFNASQIKDLIKAHTDNSKWQFVYIGANQDAFLVGHTMNIGSNAGYVASAAGTHAMYTSLTNNTRSYRMCATAQVADFFKQDDINKDDKND
jgi:hypothetical protein